MSQSNKFSDYIIKQVVIEFRHLPNLLHQDQVPVVLNKYVAEFGRVRIAEINREQKIYEIINERNFTRILSKWDSLGFLIENVQDTETVSKLFKKYFVPIAQELNLKIIKRAGLRARFLLPYNDSFESLKKYCENIFYKDINIYNTIGHVDDVGLIAINLSDSAYKINLSLGPFSTEEIKEKISEFKKYDDKVKSALMLDLDLYQSTMMQYNLSSFVKDTLEAARIKFIKFIGNIK